MAIGLGLLRVAPRDFWKMTPRELAAAIGPASPTIDRRTLSMLMKEFPDG
jgi:uncharacterized phage protein (TIGR02216 family)